MESWERACPNFSQPQDLPFWRFGVLNVDFQVILSILFAKKMFLLNKWQTRVEDIGHPGLRFMEI
jgi:hypothetical protein